MTVRRPARTPLHAAALPNPLLPTTGHNLDVRDPAPLLAQALQDWGGRSDLWVFGYASLIWRPDFDFTERHLAQVHGWHRSLQMWSHINRGSPECPGLVFALLAGGSCLGVVFRVPRKKAHDTLVRLWAREMPGGVYDPRWLNCSTEIGNVRALAFTLSRQSRSFTGPLSDAQYRSVFARSEGCYGTTIDYARQTYGSLLEHGIADAALERVLKLAEPLPQAAPSLSR
ncbi:MAG: gamma-glutamylcyclotransferase [Burkholderiaceae bacterium]